MKANVSLTKRERRMCLINLLLIYLVATALLGTLLFKNSFLSIRMDYELSRNKLNASKNCIRQQRIAAESMERISTHINQMQGSTRQVFLERDIQRTIKELRKYYDPDSDDLRQVCFSQAATFLTMQYEDKIILNKTSGNLQLFEKQLGDCEIGFKQKLDLLNQKKLMEVSRTGMR